MFSSMPLGATFFFFALAIVGKVQVRASAIVTADMIFIDPLVADSPIQNTPGLTRAGDEQRHLPLSRGRITA
jgi:hypothetical protein